MKRKVSSPTLDWLVAIIAVIVSCVLIQLMTSCKKEPINNTSASTLNGYGGTVTVTIGSNYLRSSLQVTNVTDNVSILTYNYGAAYDGDCPYTKSFTAQANKQYKIYTYSTKNSVDSTLFMVDNKTVWNSLKVQTTGGIVYQHTDSIGSGTWRICKNNYIIN